jgi:hypothetical protein
MSTAETKTITLAGQPYDVPPVTFRNASRIHPLVEKAFAAVREKKRDGGVLEEQTYIQLGQIVYSGISKTSGMTEDQFLDLIVRPHEMMNAAVIVAQQAGMVETPGEAEGVSSPQQTSTN